MLKVEQILGEHIAKMNTRNLKELEKRVSKERVTWILGAGISKSVGVPLWSECLLGMWARILLLEKQKDGIDSEFQEALNELKNNMTEPEKFLEKVNSIVEGNSSIGILSGVNTLEAAEYIQNFISEALKSDFKQGRESYDLAYTALVRDSLRPKGSPEEIFNKLENRAIGILAEYFVRKAHSNKKVEVISYNFDNLLEFALEKKGLDEKDFHIKNPDTVNVLDSEKGVHIYHPHGAVAVVPTEISVESKRLVLAENSYERLERKAYLWENSIQAKALHSTSCVFLGFSGEDYNFRRIIKNMERGKERQQIKHYLFLSIESLVKRIFTDEVNQKILGTEARTEEERKECLKGITKEEFDNTLNELLLEPRMVFEKMLILKKLYAQDQYWRSYNIIPIWTTRNELSGMVRQIINR